MAEKRRFNELVKDFNRIRPYLREFYLRGFLTRGEFEGEKSLSTYDNERRRVKSYMGEWMRRGRSGSKKTNYISIDPRGAEHSPLFRAWKSKSFTDKDITLHFVLLDILGVAEESGGGAAFPEITRKLNSVYAKPFMNPYSYDEKTVRLKLRELQSEGILRSEKRGRTAFYVLDKSFDFEKHSRSREFVDALNFFTEVLPCGVAGSFILEKIPARKRKMRFAFKHHYIAQALDAEIEHRIFEAMRENASVRIGCFPKKGARARAVNCLPLKIFQSVENGRLYLAASEIRRKNIACIRLDKILSVEKRRHCENAEERRKIFEDERKHVWGVSFPNSGGCWFGQTKRVHFTVRIDDGEEYVWQRLLREKRCGNAERLDKNAARFWADLYDVGEIKPWARTFISSITEFDFGDEETNKDFARSFEKTCEMYGL